MPCLETTKDKIKALDFFSSPASMRVRGSDSYETICGGIMSIGVIIFFISVFSTTIWNVLNKVDVQTTSDLLKDFS